MSTKRYHRSGGRDLGVSEMQKRLIYRYYKLGKTDERGWLIVRKVFRSFSDYRLRQIIDEMKNKT